MKNPLAGLMVLSLLGMVCVVQAEDTSPDKPVADFTLKDVSGAERKLSSLAESKGVVLAFIGTECPLAKLYAPRLARLAREYKDKGITVWGISPNVQDSIAELKHFAESNQIDFPMLKDLNAELAHTLGVERVPTVLVLDENRVIRYRGRIDDQYGFKVGKDGLKVSYQHNEAKRRDLAVAIDELLSGNKIEVADTPVSGCLIGHAKQSVSNPTVTFTKQITRIFNQHCVYCHRSNQIAPFSLTKYEDAAGWAEMIGEVVAERRMPPWHADPAHGEFKNDARLTEEERGLIATWIAEGAPEGDPADLPETPQFAEGWMMPEPDQIVYMDDKPFSVKAEGTVPYTNFVVDPGWTEDKWVTAMEPKPGNAKVVHHIVMYVIPPAGKKKYFTDGIPVTMLDWFASFAPGLRPPVLPDHMGRFIPAGSKLLFQMHYTPCGTEEQDRSFVGIKFADPKKVKREVAVQHAGNMFFSIPPKVANHELESWYDFTRDSLLLTVSPHMHWRGKDFKYTLHYPDGKQEVILYVPQYDFGWQTTYVLKEPKRIPKGSRLHCVAHYDNSEANLNNPDPNVWVRFGEQTWDEMMYGWFEIALDDKELDLSASAGDSNNGN